MHLEILIKCCVTRECIECLLPECNYLMKALSPLHASLQILTNHPYVVTIGKKLFKMAMLTY